MHKVRTAWPVATRVQYIVAFEDCCQSAVPRRRAPKLWPFWLRGPHCGRLSSLLRRFFGFHALQRLIRGASSKGRGLNINQCGLG
jgi:hypothetical protein